MFARVAVYEIPGNRMHEAIVAFRGAVEQIRERHPKELLVLISPEGNRALTMSLWDREGDMEASRVMAGRLRTDAAQAVGGSVQSVVEYEIAIRETAGS